MTLIRSTPPNFAMVVLRHSAFSVPRALQDQACATRTDQSQGQLSKQAQPVVGCASSLQQEQQTSGSLQPKQADPESKPAESMVPVAKSVMQSSGTGCLDVMELLSAPAR